MMFSRNIFADDYQISEGGDSMETAQEISLNQEYAVSLSYMQELWFQFTTPSNKSFLDFYSKNIDIGSNVKMEIVDAISEVKQKNVCWIEQAESKNFSLNTSQTYYIRISMVSKAEKGNIKFSVIYTEDVVGDSKSNAVDVSLNQKISGSIDGYADVDYYKIYTGKGTNYRQRKI